VARIHSDLGRPPIAISPLSVEIPHVDSLHTLRNTSVRENFNFQEVPNDDREKTKSRKTGLPLLRERRPGAEFHQAAGSPVPKVLCQTLRIGGTGEEGRGEHSCETRTQKIPIEAPRSRGGSHSTERSGRRQGRVKRRWRAWRQAR